MSGVDLRLRMIYLLLVGIITSKILMMNFLVLIRMIYQINQKMI